MSVNAINWENVQLCNPQVKSCTNTWSRQLSCHWQCSDRPKLMFIVRPRQTINKQAIYSAFNLSENINTRIKPLKTGCKLLMQLLKFYFQTKTFKTGQKSYLRDQNWLASMSWKKKIQTILSLVSSIKKVQGSYKLV